VTDVEVEVSTVFTKTRNTTKRIVINRGGTRSTKTVSYAQLIALWLITGIHSKKMKPDESGVFTIFRRFKADIERTVLNDWLFALDQLGITGIIDENKTLKTYRFGKRVVRFMGCDDEAALRGYASTHAYINEGDQCSYSAFTQIAVRTSGRIHIDFNPDDEDIWINTELEQKRAVQKGDVEVIISSYLDNRFLSTEQVEEIEWRKDNDPQWWAAFGMGQYASKRGRIFQFDIISEVPHGTEFKGYGLDFGFTNSKTALIKCWETERDLYFQGLLYESGLQNQDIVDRFGELGISKKDYIAADWAEAKTIEFIKQKGYNIHNANKDVEYGISYMKGKRIHLVAGDENLQKNFRGYKWKEDKNGVSLNEPIKIDDHYPDAGRYIATFRFIKRRPEDFFR